MGGRMLKEEKTNGGTGRRLPPDGATKGADSMPNKDEVKGKAKQATGAVKDKAGEWTKDPDLEARGEAERAEGNVQESYGKGKRKVGEAVEEAGKKIKR